MLISLTGAHYSPRDIIGAEVDLIPLRRLSSPLYKIPRLNSGLVLKACPRMHHEIYHPATPLGRNPFGKVGRPYSLQRNRFCQQCHYKGTDWLTTNLLSIKRFLYSRGGFYS